MGVPFILLAFFLQIYTAILIIYLIVRLAKRSTLPWLLVVAECICLCIFFYLKYLVDERRLVFIGEYLTDSNDWGAGLGNLEAYMKNMLIVVVIFVCVQIPFWYFFSKRKAINKTE